MTSQYFGSKNMLPSTGLLIYWLYPILLIPVCQQGISVSVLMIYCAVLAEYFNLILLSSLRSSLPLNGEIVCFVWYLPDIYLCFSLSISFLLLLNMMASGFLTFNLPFLSMSSYCQPPTSLHKLPLPTPGPSLLLLFVFHWRNSLLYQMITIP